MMTISLLIVWVALQLATEIQSTSSKVLCACGDYPTTVKQDQIRIGDNTDFIQMNFLLKHKPIIYHWWSIMNIKIIF